MPRRRAAGGDEEGVAVVVGTVMLAGLLLTTLVTVQLHFVPVWSEDAEAAKGRVLERQVLTLKAALDLQTSNATAMPFTAPLSLGDEQSSIFGTRGGAAAVLEFVGDGKAVSVAAPKLRFLVEDSAAAAAGVDEAWLEIDGNATVPDVYAIQSFRLRVTDFAGGTGQLGDYVTVRINDSDDAFAGNLTFYVADDHPDWRYNVRVCNSSPDCSGSDKLFDQGVVFHSSSGDLTEWVVDLLHPEYRFHKLLANASAPLTINLTHGGLHGEYAVTYACFTCPGGGPGSSAGSPVVTQITDFDRTWTGGTLALRAEFAHLPSPTYVIENGALVLQQPDGEVLKAEPGFALRADAAGNLTRIRLAIPSLLGHSGSASSQGTLTVRAAAVNSTVIAGHANRVTLNVTTAFPAVWAGLWQQAIDDAGSGLGAASVATGATWARLVVEGPDPDGDADAYDVELVVSQADVQLQI